mgnify:CR=1 FL=1
MIDVNFELNGKTRNESINPVKRLSEFLRNDMGLSATKVGCNAGDCGSCTRGSTALVAERTGASRIYSGAFVIISRTIVEACVGVIGISDACNGGAR